MALDSTAVLLRVRGEFDAWASASVVDLGLIDHTLTASELRHLDLDAGDVSFIGSSELRILLELVVCVREHGGTIATVNASSQFRRLLELTA